MELASDGGPSSTAWARRLLDWSAKAWFVVAVVGQLVFAFSVASFYGLTAGRGNWDAWNRSMSHGYVEGQSVGNAAVAIHLLSATIVVLCGALQLVPRNRRRVPAFHRWNGRAYLVCALLASVAGLFMIWARGAVGDLSQHLGTSLNALLVIVFAAMTLRYALARDFVRHRRWALRLYVVVLGVWFLRLELALWFVVFDGPYGFDPASFSGPALTALVWADFLLPLAVVELYWRATERPQAFRRAATAALLFVVTAATAAGALIAAGGTWVPVIRTAFDSRKSVVELLATSIRAGRIDEGIDRYRDLKATTPSVYNFDESQLNQLGYALLRARQVREAIRVFELNVEAYPRSGNVYDSVAEAHLAAGDRVKAIANYRRAVELGGKGAAEALRRLTGP